MSWTSHDKLFGWLHGFKINRNNSMIAPDPTTPTPFPAIVQQPDWKHVLSNWNRADTGVVLAMFVAGILISVRNVRNNPQIHGEFNRRYQYYRYVNIFAVSGLFLGARNSYYRLVGLVPNGLARMEDNKDMVKYDYTSSLIEGSLWGWLVEPLGKK